MNSQPQQPKKFHSRLIRNRLFAAVTGSDTEQTFSVEDGKDVVIVQERLAPIKAVYENLLGLVQANNQWKFVHPLNLQIHLSEYYFILSTSLYCNHDENRRRVKLSDYLCDECGCPEVVDRPVPELAPLQLLQHISEGGLVHGHAAAGGDAGQGLRICKMGTYVFSRGIYLI
ncbi:hypothetical protein AVEN_255617-1 [Araneus ventricosus]|uniref:Uncharacterized protein n=1 Tax=Araneus ventricosus TaxID=182803 RepID=A0A4Y2UF58_ARAVE|nr:hypothetical protein AVEN_255617-1 [Araneus ventricosus]